MPVLLSQCLMIKPPFCQKNKSHNTWKDTVDAGSLKREGDLACCNMIKGQGTSFTWSKYLTGSCEQQTTRVPFLIQLKIDYLIHRT